MTEPVSIDRIRKAFALALHAETGSAESKAAWIGALRLCIAGGYRTFDQLVSAASPEPDDPDYPYGWEMVMPFGKHKGYALGYIARAFPDYIEWLCEQKLRSRALMDAVQSVSDWLQENRH